MTDSTFTQENNNWKKLYDLTGKKISRWTVLKRLENRYENVAYWLCKCECGKESEVSGRSITQGRSKQCKDCANKINGKKQRTHGFCSGGKKPEYFIWRSMKERCFNEKNSAFKRYGARGITVCERWKDSFENFINDMGVKPSKNHSLDRIDNDQGYFPGNVRWVTIDIQQKNTSRQNLMAYGKIIPISDLEEQTGVTRSSLIKLIRDGITLTELYKYKSISSLREKTCFREKNKRTPVMIGNCYNLTPSSPE
jgi:hypothetical protein